MIDNPSVSTYSDPVLVVGNSFAPEGILDNPGYSDWHEWLETLPVREAESDLMVLPTED